MIAKRRRRLAFLAFVAGGAAVGAWGCSERDAFRSSSPPTFGGAADGSADACAATRCSLDLRAVETGCEGSSVVTPCPGGQGCSEGRCVEACAAAESSQGSRGCSFMTVPPAQQADSRGSCFAAFVANTWSEPAELAVFYKGAPLDASRSVVIPKSGGAVTYEPLVGPLPPGQVAIVFLAQGSPSQGGTSFIGCPSEPLLAVAGSRDGTGRFDAFEIRTSVPVSAYSIFPYGGALSFLPTATLLLPKSSWGTGYRLLDGWESTSIDLAPSIQIVAAEDDTVVTLTPPVDVGPGPGVPAAAAGSPTTWSLRRGEVVQIVQPARLLGAPMTANKPVALFGGSSCTFLPKTRTACDALQQQIPPQSAWGSEYAAVRYRARGGDDEELAPWRIVAAVDGTRLTYDPAPPDGAPTELGAGQSGVFSTGTPFIVKSQDADHPVFVNGYMTGGSAFSGVGDPDFVNVVPVDQYLGDYVFFSDHTYQNGSLTLVRRRTATGFHDVTVDCAGVIGGWAPIGGGGQYEYARIDLVRGGKPQSYAGGTCDHGRREAHSTGPFGLTVWGVDYYASYAYPGGSGTRRINDVVVR